MEPEGSLSCSQNSTTGPYPESHASAPQLPHFPKIHSNIIVPSTHRSYEWSLYPSSFPTKILYAFFTSSIHATCPAYLVPLYLITWGEAQKLRSSSLCSLFQSPAKPPSQIQIFSSAFRPQISSILVTAFV